MQEILAYISKATLGLLSPDRAETNYSAIHYTLHQDATLCSYDDHMYPVVLLSVSFYYERQFSAIVECKFTISSKGSNQLHGYMRGPASNRYVQFMVHGMPVLTANSVTQWYRHPADADGFHKLDTTIYFLEFGGQEFYALCQQLSRAAAKAYYERSLVT